MSVFAEALIVVSGLELGSVAAPRRLLDHAINVAWPLGGYAQRNDLADPHHYIPADYLRALRRKSLVEPWALNWALI
jgi:hypothetical protein